MCITLDCWRPHGVGIRSILALWQILSALTSDPPTLYVIQLLKVQMRKNWSCNNVMWRGFILSRGQPSFSGVFLNFTPYCPLWYHTLPMAQQLPMLRSGQSMSLQSMVKAHVRGSWQPNIWKRKGSSCLQTPDRYKLGSNGWQKWTTLLRNWEILARNGSRSCTCGVIQYASGPSKTWPFTTAKRGSKLGWFVIGPLPLHPLSHLTNDGYSIERTLT